MPIVDYDAYYARKEREQERKAMAKTHRCGVCGAALSNPYIPDLDEVGVVCSRDRGHQGYERIRGASERYKAGEMLSGDIAQAIKRKLEKQKKEAT